MIVIHKSNIRYDLLTKTNMNYLRRRLTFFKMFEYVSFKMYGVNGITGILNLMQFSAMAVQIFSLYYQKLCKA